MNEREVCSSYVGCVETGPSGYISYPQLKQVYDTCTYVVRFWVQCDNDGASLRVGIRKGINTFDVNAVKA